MTGHLPRIRLQEIELLKEVRGLSKAQALEEVVGHGSCSSSRAFRYRGWRS